MNQEDPTARLESPVFRRGEEVNDVLAICPCGADVIRRSGRARDAHRKFCSQRCAGTYGGGRRPPSDRCPGCGWPKDAENTYQNGACRRCALAKGRPDYVPGPRGKPKPRARPEKPSPAPESVKADPEPAPARRWLSAPGWTT